METIKAIMTRRSIRNFTKKSVGRPEIILLLESAMNAPSAGNQQAWQFVVVTERETLVDLSKAHPYAGMLLTAPLAVAVCGDPGAEKHPGYWVQDCSAAVQNILLAAHSEGLGAVWLGVHPRAEREKNIGKILGLPERMTVLALVAIGYPARKLKPQKRYDESKVHYEKW